MGTRRAGDEGDFPRTMNATDSLMWRVEADPLLRSTVTALSVLDGPPDWEELQHRLVLATSDVPRLTQHVVGPRLVGSPHWEVDPSFDLAYHLRRLRLRDATFESVLTIAAESAMAGFDRSRPPWEFLLLDGLADGRSVLVQKFHHSVTDGVGGLRLASRLFDLERRPAVTATGDAPEHGAAPAPRPSRLRSPLAAPVSAAAAAVSLSRRLCSAAVSAAHSPLDTSAAAADAVRWGARLLAPVRSPFSPVLRRRSASLRFDTLDFDLATLREAAKAVGCKLNDAFLGAVVGGLARYHVASGAPVERLRMTLPISLRTDADPLASNRITLVRFPVPCAETHIPGRLRSIRDLVAEWRGGRAPALTDLLASGLNALPDQVLTGIFGQMLKNVDFVATNVPGFPVPFYVAGAEVERLYAFAPTCGAALNVSMVSHVGRCCIGINSDPAAVADRGLLLASLEEGFAEVLSLAPSAARVLPALANHPSG